MATTCARIIAIQRQNTPRKHIPTPREIHQTLDESRIHFQALTPENAVQELERVIDTALHERRPAYITIPYSHRSKITGSRAAGS
jgi:hypothetical protein